MELIDNVNKTLRDDLRREIGSGSKVSIAAACFSIYAFQELKDQLKAIEELRFIFTSSVNGKEIGEVVRYAHGIRKRSPMSLV